MTNWCAFLGLLLPTLVTVPVIWNTLHDLHSETSGEVAIAHIFGSTFMGLGSLLIGCLLNAFFIYYSLVRKEPRWRIAFAGIPLCIVITTILLIAKK